VNVGVRLTCICEHVPNLTWSRMLPDCLLAAVSQFECEDYTHGSNTTCNSCPPNSQVVATRDNCICRNGYVPQAGTSSREENLECVTCGAGKYAVAGDSTCTACTGNTYSNAAAPFCEACPSGTQANALKTDCVCVGTGCTKSGSGWNTVCSSCSGGSSGPGEQFALKAVAKVTCACRHSESSTVDTHAEPQHSSCNVLVVRWLKVLV
jgi:hypothetical protein